MTCHNCGSQDGQPFEPVKVHVVADSTKGEQPARAPQEMNATWSTFSVGNAQDAALILPHAAKRRRAVIQITGGPANLGSTKADVKAQNNGTAQFQAFAGAFYLDTTREVWAYSANAGAVAIAVVQEFDPGGP